MYMKSHLFPPPQKNPHVSLINALKFDFFLHGKTSFMYFKHSKNEIQLQLNLPAVMLHQGRIRPYMHEKLYFGLRANVIYI